MSDLVLTSNRHNTNINEQDDYDYSFLINCLVLQIFSVLKHVACDVIYCTVFKAQKLTYPSLFLLKIHFDPNVAT